MLEPVSSVPQRENPEIKNIRNILKGIVLINLKIEKTTKNLENLDRPIHLIVLAVMNVLSEIIELK